jgi:hypothetical protein
MWAMNKRNLKRALKRKTGCAVQHDGWPCGTCFFALSKELTNQDWQALLLYRGDYTKDELDNLPDGINASLDKILEACGL